MSLGTLEGLSPGILIPQSPSPFLTTGTQVARERVFIEHALDAGYPSAVAESMLHCAYSRSIAA
jgi:hypothetical protein